jgi:hypothetical protein
MPIPIIVVGVTMQVAVLMIKWYVISKIRERREQKKLEELLSQQDTLEEDEFISLPEPLNKQTEIELQQNH